MMHNPLRFQVLDPAGAVIAECEHLVDARVIRLRRGAEYVIVDRLYPNPVPDPHLTPLPLEGWYE